MSEQLGRGAVGFDSSKGDFSFLIIAIRVYKDHSLCAAYRIRHLRHQLMARHDLDLLVPDTLAQRSAASSPAASSPRSGFPYPMISTSAIIPPPSRRAAMTAKPLPHGRGSEDGTKPSRDRERERFGRVRPFSQAKFGRPCHQLRLSSSTSSPSAERSWNPERHLPGRVRRAAQARVEGADHRFDAVQHAFVRACCRRTKCLATCSTPRFIARLLWPVAMIRLAQVIRPSSSTL